MNIQNNRKFYGLLKKHNIQKQHAALAATGWSDRSSDITDEQANWFITEGYKKLIKAENFTPDLEEARKDKKRKQLIAMAFSIGEDIQFIKGWCEKYGINEGEKHIKKKFNDYTLSELIKLEHKFNKVVTDRIMSTTK